MFLSCLWYAILLFLLAAAFTIISVSGPLARVIADDYSKVMIFLFSGAI